MIYLKIGDNRELIYTVQDKVIDCVVTSPPYWGLRDYGTQPLIFDGDSKCEHEWTNHHQPPRFGKNLPDNMPEVGSNKSLQETCLVNGGYDSNFCSKCGAWLGQLGLEPSPELFIEHLVQLFDSIKLKLKDEGNCFVNLGDTYNSGGSTGKMGGFQGKMSDDYKKAVCINKNTKIGLPEKCLCMVPQRFAWKMIEHGWILRNEIIWHKPNHMPESVNDRLTKAHEVIYHFVKQEKYYYNLDAIREPHKWADVDKRSDGKKHESEGKSQESQYAIDGVGYNPKGKNPGDVWSVNTEPYGGAHFAVFPTELVKIPILAGCPVNGIVLDPFAGSGTVGKFCRHNNRNAVLFELNPEYKKLIEDRTMMNVADLTSF